MTRSNMNTVCYIDEIQPTMVATVRLLQERGFRTCDSGDGVLNVEAGMEGAMEFPHVFCKVSAGMMIEEAHRLWELTREFEMAGAKVESTYDPADHLAFLCLIDVTDATWAQLKEEE